MDITIVLIRHAQHQDTGGITGGDQDPSLSENGIGEAKRLGDIFERVYPNTYHIVYHSGMERAKQTAELAFAGKDVEYKALRKLKEIRHRLTEGMKPEERDAMWKDFVADEIKKWKEEHPGEEIDPKFKYYIHPRGAETYNHLKLRVQAAIRKEFGEKEISENEVVAIVTHNAVMQVLISDWKIRTGEFEKEKKDDGTYPMFFEKLKDGKKSLLDNCSMAEFKYHQETDEMEFVRLVEPV